MATDQKKKRSLAGIAGIVGIATLISKVFGLVREQAIAAAFGVGVVVNAYAFAYVIPGFLLILLGGINGPFHSSLVSVLSKREKQDAAPIVETITTLVSCVLLVFTILLVCFSGLFIDIVAPGLDSAVRALAIQQLRIMAPLTLLAGLIGIGFGTLNASDQYWLPSISPLFSSLTVIIGVGVLAWQMGDRINTPEFYALGGIVLAGGTLLGAILQWFMQLIAQSQSGMGKLRLRFNWRIPGVMDVVKVMAPATLSSGMLYINVYTDMFFASFIPNAAASMRYANFIVLTPLGIISNVILVPFMPVFSRLATPEHWPELKKRIRMGIFLTALTMLPFTAIFIALAMPIVRVIYERGAFNQAASGEVVPVLMAYGFGMFFYLGRDVLVRVFYALEDGTTPYRVSILSIVLNFVFDAFLYRPFGTPGLILATVAVNIISMVIFIVILDRRLGGLPLGNWSRRLFSLIVITVISAMASGYVSELWGRVIGSEGLLVQLGQVIVGSLVAIAIFFGSATLLRFPEMQLLSDRILKKIRKN